MIVLKDVWFDANTDDLRISGLTAAIPTDRRLAILGPRDTGKVGLMRLIGGLDKPDDGSITRYANVSFPLGRPLGLIAKHTVRRNTVFAARIYRLDPSQLIQFVARVADLSGRLDIAIEKLEPFEATRFRYTLFYGLPFDTYVVEGDPYPRGGAIGPDLENLISERLRTKGFIILTTSTRLALRYCDQAATFDQGRLRFFDSLERAVVAHNTLEEQEGHFNSRDNNRLSEARRALRRGETAMVQAIADAEYEESGESWLALWLFGELTLARGDREEGGLQILQACEAAAPVDEPWATLARLAETEEEPERALTFAQVLLLHHDLNVQRLAARIIARFDDAEAALDTWRTLADSNPDNLELALEAVEFEIKFENHAEALTMLDRVLAIDPDLWRALHAKVRAEMALGWTDAAELTIERLRTLRPDLAERLQRLLARSVRSATLAGQQTIVTPPSESADPEAAEDADPLERSRRATSDVFATFETPSPTEEAVKLWMVGERHLAEGDAETGTKFILDACRMSAEADKPWKTLVRLAKTETDQGLMVSYADAFLDHPRGGMRRIGAKLIDRTGDAQASVLAWRRVSSGEVEDPTLLMEAAEIETKAGHTIEAIELLDRALAMNGDLWRALYAKAKCEQSLGDFVELTRTLTRLERFRPELVEHVLRAMSRVRPRDEVHRVRAALSEHRSTAEAEPAPETT